MLSPYVAVRLTADVQDAESFRDGISSRQKMISPSVLYQNPNGFRWLLQYTYDDAWRVPDRGPSYDNLPRDVSRRTAFAHPDDWVTDTQHYARSDMSFDFGNSWKVRWVAGYRKASQDFDHIYGGSYCSAGGRLPNGNACANPGRLQGFTRAWQFTDNVTVSNTLDVTGKANLLGMQHDLLVGFELSEEKRQPRLATHSFAQTIDPFDPGGWIAKPPHGNATQHNDHRAESQAIYVQDLITIAPQWKAPIGLRYDRFEFKSTNQITGAQRAYRDGNLSPRAGIIWQPSSNHSLYASYSKNFSPYGGRGLLSVSVASDAVYDAEPQYSRQYEIGIKSDWLGERLSSQIAVYDLRHYNIRYQPDAINDPYTWAVRGMERSRGVELTLAGRVARDWYLRGGVGFMQAKVVEDRSSPQREDQYKSGVPRRNASVHLRYSPQGSFFAEGGATYVSSRWVNVPNVTEMSGYVRWDALVGWRKAPWTFTVAINNLTDKDYWCSASMPGTPRSIFAQGTYRF